MLKHLAVPLEVEERRALDQIAEAEMRWPEHQARYLLRREMERRGLLTPQPERAGDPGRKELTT